MYSHGCRTALRNSVSASAILGRGERLLYASSKQCRNLRACIRLVRSRCLEYLCFKDETLVTLRCSIILADLEQYLVSPISRLPRHYTFWHIRRLKAQWRSAQWSSCSRRRILWSPQGPFVPILVYLVSMTNLSNEWIKGSDWSLSWSTYLSIATTTSPSLCMPYTLCAWSSLVRLFVSECCPVLGSN